MAEVDLERRRQEAGKQSGTNYHDIQRATPPSKPAKTEAKPLVKKKAIVREKKRTFGDQIVDNISSIDHDQIRKRLLYDWLFPEVISTIDDLLRMIFLGDRNGGKRRRSRDGYTHYSTTIADVDSRKKQEREDRDPTRQNFRRIRLEFFDKDDAETVRDDLRERLEESESGIVGVKELYSHELVNMPTNSAMYKWGWFDLEDISIERDGDVYVLEMPRAEVIR